MKRRSLILYGTLAGCILLASLACLIVAGTAAQAHIATLAQQSLLSLTLQPTATPTTTNASGTDPAIIAAWIGVIGVILGAVIGGGITLYLARRSEKRDQQLRAAEEKKASEKQAKTAEEQRLKHEAQEKQAAGEAMQRAQTATQRIEAYRQALHADPRIAELQILKMNQPIEVANVFVRVRLHQHKTEYNLPAALVVAQMQHDPNELLHATRLYLDERSSTAIDPDAAIRQYHRCIFVGDPGAGKTTLLKYLTLRSADGQLTNLPDLPIHVELNTFASSGATDLLAFTATTWQNRYKFPQKEARTAMEEALSKGKALLLLDALDETVIGTTSEEADASYKRASEAITDIATRYPQAPIVVSARKAGYYQHARLVGFTELEVLDFRPEEIAQFIDNWFACSPLTSKHASAADLKKRLTANPRLQSLAANPLLLSLIVIVYEDRLDLPEQRARLYEQCMDVLLHKWDRSRDILRRRAFTPEQKQLLLEEIAWHFHRQGQRYLLKSELLNVIADFLPALNQPREQAESVLAEIAALHGLLKEQAHDWYGFLHLTLQEYCAAVYATRNNKLAELLTHVGDSWWEEVILLYAGHAPDASPLLQRLMGSEAQPFQHDDLFHSNLLLAGRCLAAHPPAIRTPTLRDTTIAALFQELQQTHYGLYRQHITETLAEIGGQAIKNRLLAMLSNEQVDIFVRWSIAEALGRFGDTSVVPTLLSLLGNEQVDEFVRESVATALAQLGDTSVIPALLSLLSNEQVNGFVRKSIAEILGQLGDTSVIPSLLSLLNNEQVNPTVCWNIAEALGQLGDTSVIPALLSLLSNEQVNGLVRGRIAGALGQLGDTSVIPALLSLLSNERDHQFVRASIAGALEQLGGTSVIPTLLTLLSNEQEGEFVRECIAATLGPLGNTSVIPTLLSLLSNEQVSKVVRVSIADALGQLGDTSVIPALLSLSNNEQVNQAVRESIAIVLGQLGDTSVIPTLLSLLNNKQIGQFVRGKIASNLGQLGDTSVIPALLSLLNNEQEDEYVHRSIIDALGQLGNDAKTIRALATLLKSSGTQDEDIQDEDIQDNVYSALWEISRRMRVRIAVSGDEHGQQVEIMPFDQASVKSPQPL